MTVSDGNYYQSSFLAASMGHLVETGRLPQLCLLKVTAYRVSSNGDSAPLLIYDATVIDPGTGHQLGNPSWVKHARQWQQSKPQQPQAQSQPSRPTLQQAQQRCWTTTATPNPNALIASLKCYTTPTTTPPAGRSPPPPAVLPPVPPPPAPPPRPSMPSSAWPTPQESHRQQTQPTLCQQKRAQQQPQRQQNVRRLLERAGWGDFGDF